MYWLFRHWFAKEYTRCQECASVVAKDNATMHKLNAHGVKSSFKLKDDFGPKGRRWD